MYRKKVGIIYSKMCLFLVVIVNFVKFFVMFMYCFIIREIIF